MISALKMVLEDTLIQHSIQGKAHKRLPQPMRGKYRNERGESEIWIVLERKKQKKRISESEMSNIAKDCNANIHLQSTLK